MNDHEKIHYEALLHTKQERINQLEQDAEKQIEKLKHAKHRLAELEAVAESEPKPVAETLTVSELRRHVDLLEAALIGAGQESGVYAIRQMVYAEIEPENAG